MVATFRNTNIIENLSGYARLRPKSINICASQTIMLFLDVKWKFRKVMYAVINERYDWDMLSRERKTNPQILAFFLKRKHPEYSFHELLLHYCTHFFVSLPWFEVAFVHVFTNWRSLFWFTAQVSDASVGLASPKSTISKSTPLPMSTVHLLSFRSKELRTFFGYIIYKISLSVEGVVSSLWVVLPVMRQTRTCILVVLVVIVLLLMLLLIPFALWWSPRHVWVIAWCIEVEPIRLIIAPNLQTDEIYELQVFFFSRYLRYQTDYRIQKYAHVIDSIVL